MRKNTETQTANDDFNNETTQPRRRSVVRKAAAGLALAGAVVAAGAGSYKALEGGAEADKVPGISVEAYNGVLYLKPGTKLTLERTPLSNPNVTVKPREITIGQGEAVVRPLRGKTASGEPIAMFNPTEQDAAQETPQMKEAGGIMATVPFDSLHVTTNYNNNYDTYNGFQVTKTVRDANTIYTYQLTHADPNTPEEAGTNPAMAVPATGAEAADIAQHEGYNVNAWEPTE